MKVMNRLKASIAVVLLGCVLPAGVGCDSNVVSELAEITAAYLGDVVSTVAAGYLEAAWDVEATGAEHDHENGHDHAHDAGPLHEYER